MAASFITITGITINYRVSLWNDKLDISFRPTVLFEFLLEITSNMKERIY